ncbi:MAG TPA: hypothetical protein VFQ27_12820 [Xanthobacteraceae bacterium]|nr:hypothetical protein [Xanthobacteraceae bacterium]
MRVLLMMAMAAALSLAGGMEAQAQKKKTDYICGPNGIEQCMKTCAARGGRVQACPQWCNSQKVQRCR